MSVTRVKLVRFTAFESLNIELSPGVNVIIGENGTGKTHLLQAAYAACDVSKAGHFPDKLVRVFTPFENRIGRMVNRSGKSASGSVEVSRGDLKLRTSFTNHSRDPSKVKSTGETAWRKRPTESVYIPVKEVLANAPGFRSLYAARDIAFSEVYSDLIDRALRPILRGPHTPDRRRLLASIQGVMEGKVSVEDENFFLTNRHGKLEFSLVSEGMRKLALIWILIQNGTLLEGTVLFWDEPESNLNPRKIGALVGVLLELQRMGVQILMATHDYVLIKEISLQAEERDLVRFHALYRGEGGKVLHEAADSYVHLQENAITATWADIYDRDVRRSLGLSSCR